MENIELWKRYANPPEEALKGFDNGSFRGTDISPMWRIRCLTEAFGACGVGWYSEIVEHWTDECGGILMAQVRIRLYLKQDNGEWSKPIEAIGGNSFVRKAGGKPSDEVYKMAETDAIGGACKKLGIGNAIYWERGYSKYEAYYTETPSETDEDAAYRALCLRKVQIAALDASCLKRFGTPFKTTPVKKLRGVLPEDKLNEMEDLT